MALDDPRPCYTPPTDGEPLDAVQMALVKLWTRLIVADIRAELAAQGETAPEATGDARGPSEP